jgi:hypothetical protein
MPTNLDQNQIMQLVFNEKTKRLAVDATVVAKVTDTEINADDSDIAIRDPSSGNSLAINTDGSINANVAINSSEDNILIVGSENGTLSGTKRPLKVDGSGNAKTLTVNSIIPFEYDAIYYAYPDDYTEVFVYKYGGVTVATVTATYEDTAKNKLLSLVRT